MLGEDNMNYMENFFSSSSYTYNNWWSLGLVLILLLLGVTCVFLAFKFKLKATMVIMCLMVVYSLIIVFTPNSVIDAKSLNSDELGALKQQETKYTELLNTVLEKPLESGEHLGVILKDTNSNKLKDAEIAYLLVDKRDTAKNPLVYEKFLSPKIVATYKVIESETGLKLESVARQTSLVSDPLETQNVSESNLPDYFKNIEFTKAIFLINVFTAILVIVGLVMSDVLIPAIPKKGFKYSLVQKI